MNRNQDRRDEIIGDCFEDADYSGGLRSYGGLDIAKLKTLEQEGFLDLEETQNNSPSIAKFMAFMAKHPKVTCHGYVISRDRSDYRVSIEGLSCKDADATPELRRAFAVFCRRADELDAEETGDLRSWWD